jgi:hypothetical protein
MLNLSSKETHSTKNCREKESNSEYILFEITTQTPNVFA